jgi:hypothetical protein
MTPVGSTPAPRPSQAFTVLIPRGLQATVDGLSAEIRQAVLAEVFRMASLAWQERGLLPASAPYTLKLDVADCQVSVELDPARTRLSLTGLIRSRPH